MRSSTPRLRRSSITLAVLLGLSTLLASGALVLADDRFVPDWQPRTNGTLVVRHVISGTGPDLDLVDLRTGESSTLAATAAHEGPADIDGDWIVWLENSFPQSRRDCTNRILAKNANSGQPIAIAENLLDPTAPRVSGNLIVWGSLKGRCPTEGEPASVTGESALTIFDLDQGSFVTTIGPLAGSLSNPAIDEDRVI